jgi:HAE1 family hydrophobic/amphiphilic exporter-1
MNIIDTSIKKPVTVIVLVALIVLFGVLSLTRLPYQLTPNVTQPEISITTLWPGATPYEIEREITQKQESEIKSTPSLTAYESTSSDNVAAITLTFKIGTDMNKALLEVSNKLNQVDRYPLNVQKPIISAAGENTSPVIWMGFIVDKGNERDIDSYKTFLDEQIKAKFERIEGVASIFESVAFAERM